MGNTLIAEEARLRFDASLDGGAALARKEMDSYVVYIYRRPDREGGNLAGLVERVADGERTAFRSEEQLLEYLLGDKTKSAQKASNRNTPKKVRRR